MVYPEINFLWLKKPLFKRTIVLIVQIVLIAISTQ